MHLTRKIKWQLALVAMITAMTGFIVVTNIIRLPELLLGIGHYTVTVELDKTGGLYPDGNVTYRGTEVGRIKSVGLTDNGAEAVLSLDSDVSIPSDLVAEVHSQSAIGEQYIALLPRNGTAAPLKDGDVIAVADTTVPPDINSLLDASNRGLEAIPRHDLQTVVDESYAAIGGLGPDLARLVRGSTTLSIDAAKNLEALTGLIDNAKPVLDTQAESADAIKAWAQNLAEVSGQVRDADNSLSGLLSHGPGAAEQARQLMQRLKPTLPVLLANLVSVGDVAVAYQPAIEQLLVLLPAGTAADSAGVVANMNTKQDYRGTYLDFNLNLNLPRPCTTGFLPAQQMRTPNFQDSPDRIAGDLYCRIPQDSPVAVRGARNYPCLTVPGKRAPTVEMCESNEQFVPLNQGTAWKGDPNATYTDQGIPQMAPGEAPAAAAVPAPPPPSSPPAPIAVATYDPATGTYVGADGRVYTQSDLAQQPKEQTWQSMLIPNNP